MQQQSNSYTSHTLEQLAELTSQVIFEYDIEKKASLFLVQPSKKYGRKEGEMQWKTLFLF
jgi:hypothetical protein